MSPALDWIGWLATAIFAASYFCKQPAFMSRIQALAAIVWIAYGVLLSSQPMVVANLIVAVLAGYSSWRTGRSGSAS